MFNPFTKIVEGLEWVGQHVGLIPKELEKVITVAEDVNADAETLCPQAIALIGDTTQLAEACVKDSGVAIEAFGTLSAAITTAIAAKGLNFAADESVAAAVEAFGKAIVDHGTWEDVINGLHKTVADAGQFGASAKAALAKLEVDVKA